MSNKAPQNGQKNNQQSQAAKIQPGTETKQETQVPEVAANNAAVQTPATPVTPPAATQSKEIPQAKPVPVQTKVVEVEESETITLIELFDKVIELAKDNKVQLLHAKNVAESVVSLLELKNTNLTSQDYAAAGSKLAYLCRSLATLEDHVFVEAFPALLDAVAAKMGDKDCMFTDSVAPFKILTNSPASLGLSIAHRQFITTLHYVAPKAQRRGNLQQIDLAVNLAVLPDSKRNLVKQIYRN